MFSSEYTYRDNGGAQVVPVRIAAVTLNVNSSSSTCIELGKTVKLPMKTMKAWRGRSWWQTSKEIMSANSGSMPGYSIVTISFSYLSASYLILSSALILSLDPRLQGSLQRHTPLKHHILGYRVFALFIF